MGRGGGGTHPDAAGEGPGDGACTGTEYGTDAAGARSKATGAGAGDDGWAGIECGVDSADFLAASLSSSSDR